MKRFLTFLIMTALVLFSLFGTILAGLDHGW